MTGVTHETMVTLKELNDRLDDGVSGIKSAKAGVEAALAALTLVQAQVDALKQALLVACGPPAHGVPT